MDEEEPWIEIDSIKWSRSNLQYDPTVSIAGWEPGYHLAKNPWDYYYMEKKGELSIGTIALPDNYCNSKFDTTMAALLLAATGERGEISKLATTQISASATWLTMLQKANMRCLRRLNLRV